MYFCAFIKPKHVLPYHFQFLFFFQLTPKILSTNPTNSLNYNNLICFLMEGLVGYLDPFVARSCAIGSGASGRVAYSPHGCSMVDKSLEGCSKVGFMLYVK
jgi:hypothetical protein